MILASRDKLTLFWRGCHPNLIPEFLAANPSRIYTKLCHDTKRGPSQLYTNTEEKLHLHNSEPKIKCAVSTVQYFPFSPHPYHNMCVCASKRKEHWAGKKERKKKDKYIACALLGACRLPTRGRMHVSGCGGVATEKKSP